MEFAFTEEQIMIRDTAAAFLAEVSDSESVRRAMNSDLGYDQALWQRICGEMYWQAIHLPEAVGGLGLGYVELAATMEQMGRSLLCAPFFSTVALASNAIRMLATDEQQELLLPRLIEGETATLAWMSAGQRDHLSGVAGRYSKDGDGYVLNGDYRYVVDGHSSQLLLLAAEGEQGVQVFVVESATDGVSCEWLPTMDQTRRQAAVKLDGVKLPSSALLGAGATDAREGFEAVLHLATIALAAEQVGVAQQALDATVEYIAERQQFNRPVGSFQAVKHKAADMMLKSEVARSAVYYAACVAEDALAGGPLSGELAEAASIAKAYCSEAARFNTGVGIQLHGGVGFTWEYDIQLYFKRAQSSYQLLGEPAAHREQVAAMLLDDASPAEKGEA